MRVFVSFFLDSKQIFIFFSFVISSSPIQLYTLFYLQELYFICSNFILFAAGFFNLQQLYLICRNFSISACPLWATVAMSTCSDKQRTLFCEVCPVYLTNRMCFSFFCRGTLIYNGVRHHRDQHCGLTRHNIKVKENVFESWKRHCVTHWREQRCVHSYLQRKIRQSDCEVRSNCEKNYLGLK